MSSFRLRHARAHDAASAVAVVIAAEVALNGRTTYTQGDLESEWQHVELDHDVWVAEDEAGLVGYASLQDRGELFRGELYAHPRGDVAAVGAGTLELLERVAAERGARRIQVPVFETDGEGRNLLSARDYRVVRLFREMRIELEAAPEPATPPAGLRFDEFDPGRDARAFHAAHQEAFADHWEYSPRTFEAWSKNHLENEKFEATLWNVVRAGDEIVGGTINLAPLYGGGWVASLFTRRAWRGRGVGRALLQDSFRRFWEHGERSVGLGVDADGDLGAFRLYEHAGMKPVLAWVMFEKELGGAA